MANFPLISVSRSAWGCPNESPESAPRYTTVTHLIIHHTVLPRDDGNWALAVRDIWDFHTITRGWEDIGYNVLIDPAGVLYEGRAGGDGVRGAHFICANENTMGIALIGNFEETMPTTATISTLIDLLTSKCLQYGIDPLASTWHEATKLYLPNIAGHRDGNQAPSDSGACPAGTLCPGNSLYEQLPEIRYQVSRAVSDLLGGVKEVVG